MENFIYSNPVTMLFGQGQVDEVARQILPYGRRILWVYGQRHIKESGVYERTAKVLKEAGITFLDLGGVHSNPRVDLVRQGIEICRKEGVDLVLAVGGGSCSDTAKAIGVGAKAGYDIWEAYEDFHNLMHGAQGDFPHVPVETLPVGVVMTKAGTGSEFDYTTVLSNWETHEKLMIINKVLYPKFAICDPRLTFTLPREQVAYGTADIMTHYMEQYFTPSKDTAILDRNKEAGIKTVIEAGRRAVENPRDYVAQSYLLYCAAWACSDHNMTGAVPEWSSHMIEHEISAATDLNHGLGMAIIYLAWMEYVLDTIPERFAQFGERVWGLSRNGGSDREIGAKSIERTREFWRSLGIPTTLSAAGVDRSILPTAARQAVRFGPIGSLKQLTEADVTRILQSVV